MADNNKKQQKTWTTSRSLTARPFGVPFVVGALVMMMLACEDSDDEEHEGRTGGAAGEETGGRSTGGEAGAVSGGTGGEAGAVTGGRATGGGAGEETGGRTTGGEAGAVSGGTGGEAGAATGGRATGGEAGAVSGGTGGEAGAVTGGTGGEAGARTGGTAGVAGAVTGGTGGVAGAATGGTGGAAGAATGGAAGATTDPFSVGERCTSGTMWTSGFNARMRPGEACISCHESAEGPVFSAAGTVYATGHEPNDCNGAGNSDAVVVVTEDGGQTHELTVNQAGNFTLSTALSVPYTAKVVVGTKERDMASSQSSGDCNLCHTQSGRNGAPGRVVLP